MEPTNSPSWIIPILIGVLFGIPAAVGVRGYLDDPLRNAATAVAAHHETLNDIVGRQLGWAEQQGAAGLAPRLAPIRDFFEEARQGTRPFAEDVLGWTSKYTLARDYVMGEKQHEGFMAARFAARVFAPEDLEQLVQASVATYVQHLDDVDSEFLVRLQADLAGVPTDMVPAGVDREAIQASLRRGLSEAVRSVKTDLRGNVGREVVSLVAGEVLSVAAVKLVTSAGLLGVGASSSTVTVGLSLVVSVIVDYIVGWAYEKLYDPVGEISRKLNEILTELEGLILHGSDGRTGVEGQLRHLAVRRSRARTILIQAAMAP